MARIGFRNRLTSESGAELVETALTLPLLLLVVVGIIEFGFVFQKYEVITNAAREGARVAVLPAFSPADAEERVKQYLDAAGLDRDDATVAMPLAAVDDYEDLGGTCIWTRTVTVSYPHAAPFLAGIGSYFGGTFGTFTLYASTKMRSEITAGTCP